MYPSCISANLNENRSFDNKNQGAYIVFPVRVFPFSFLV